RRGPAALAARLLGLVQPARHRSDDRAMPRGARDAPLRRLLRRLEQHVGLPRPRPRAPGPRLPAPRRGGDLPLVGGLPPQIVFFDELVLAELSGAVPLELAASVYA